MKIWYVNQKSHKNLTNTEKMEFIFNPKSHTFLFFSFSKQTNITLLYRAYNNRIINQNPKFLSDLIFTQRERERERERLPVEAKRRQGFQKQFIISKTGPTIVWKATRKPKKCLLLWKVGEMKPIWVSIKIHIWAFSSVPDNNPQNKNSSNGNESRCQLVHSIISISLIVN